MAEKKRMSELLEAAAKSGKPLNVNLDGYRLLIYVKADPSSVAPDPPDYRSHPLTLGGQLRNRARSVGR